MAKYIKYNLDATDENIENSIKDNAYSRNDSVKSFIEALDMIDTNMFISIDAKWGEGKTFFVKQIEKTLLYITKKQLGEDVSSFEDIFSKSSLKDVSLNNTYLPIYYNAWSYDYHSNPLLSLIAVVVKECGKYVSTQLDTPTISKKLNKLIPAFSLFGGRVSIDIKDAINSIQGKDILDEIKTSDEITDLVKQILDDVITESAQKLVIFIDELDRCKPSYAIDLLERIKHFFDDERIIFVVSLNKEQMAYTISKYYGTGFDSTGYLNRFFDVNICLPEISLHQKRNSIFSVNREQSHVKYIVNDLSDYYRLSLRDTIIYQQNMEMTSKQFYDDYTTQGCLLSIFVPIIKVLEIVDSKKKNEFLNGDENILEELFSNIPSLYTMACVFCNATEETKENFEVGYKKIHEIFTCEFGSGKKYRGTINYTANLKNMCVRISNGNL